MLFRSKRVNKRNRACHNRWSGQKNIKRSTPYAHHSVIPTAIASTASRGSWEHRLPELPRDARENCRSDCHGGAGSDRPRSLDRGDRGAGKESGGEKREALKWAQDNNVPIFVLGGGSNLLVADKGYNGLVIFLQNNKFKFKGNKLIVDAGMPMQDLVRVSVERGLRGLEWAGGLPGQLGGAIRGNANCFGGHTHDVVKKVRVMSPDGSIKTFNKRQCRFSHKSSIFKQNPKYIILSAELKFKKGNKKKLQEKVDYCMNWRAQNQPQKHGTF